MKTPQFDPSRRFLGKYDVPCLVAEVKNSEVPGVATKYLADTGKDPTCAIYLRGKDSEKMSPWMQAKLEQLFDQDGLTAAVAEGLKELEAGFDSLGEEMCHDIKTHGYHPYVFIQEVVIDEIKQRVLIRIDDIGLDIIHEHGGTIYLKRGRWHFAEAEYFIYYSSSFDKRAIKPDRAKWDEMFPPPERGTRAEKDCSFLYGRWEGSEVETNELRKELGWDAVHRSDCFYSITETEIEGYSCAIKRQVSSVKRRGNWITVKYMVKDYRATIQFWCDGASLVENDGTVYRRVADSKLEVASRATA